MAKKSIGEKAERVLQLLMGLRNRKVASAMAARGFTQEDLDEGFTLLRGVTHVSLAVLPPVGTDPQIITDLDEWENTWFPVADATLARHYPEVREKVFLNLSQTEGPAVLVSVGTFIERVAALTKAEGGYGQQGKDARKLLHKRGLTPAVIDRAKALMEQVKEIEPEAEPPDLESQRVDVAKAEEAMWGWYLEWGQIARSAIKDRVLLRRLGFLESRGRRTPAVEPSVDPDDATIAATGGTVIE